MTTTTTACPACGRSCLAGSAVRLPGCIDCCHCRECSDCLRCIDCTNCHQCRDCYDCSGFTSACYVWAGEQLTRKAYEERLARTEYGAREAGRLDG